MDFGQALKVIKDGGKVSRSVWDEDQFVTRQSKHHDGSSCNKQAAESWGVKEEDLTQDKPYLELTTGLHCNMWIPSSSDILAEDWEMVE